MEREHSVPRPGWQRKLEEIGFTYHSMDGRYWDESVCYSFTAEEIDMLESVTAELHEMCIEAAGAIIERDWFDRLAIPEHARNLIVDSWNRDEPSLYGRFDFSYDGRYPPKLLEYNADTPTSLIECGAAQWLEWVGDFREPRVALDGVGQLFHAEVNGAAPDTVARGVGVDMLQ